MSKEIEELTVTLSANLGPSCELGVGWDRDVIGKGDRPKYSSRSRTLPRVESRDLRSLAHSRSAALQIEQSIKCGISESVLLENSQILRQIRMSDSLGLGFY